MELRHLRSFIVVAQEKSFTRAACRLNIAQPPLSNRIRELEEELGVKLFERHTRCVELTQAGHEYLKHIEQIFTMLDRAQVASQAAQQGKVGRLGLGYTGRASQDHLPSLLNKFRQAYPDVNLDIQGPWPTGELRLHLLDKKLDAVLCFLPLEGTDIATHCLSESEFAIVLPSSHRYADAKNLDIRLLSQEAFVAYPSARGFHLRMAMDEICMDNGFVPHVVRESEASQTLLCLVAAGVGITIMPKEIKKLDVEGVVLIDLPKETRKLQHGLAWLESNTNPVLKHLLSELK
jgi:DNA-binding transcriptional LysR family regulator